MNKHFSTSILRLTPRHSSRGARRRGALVHEATLAIALTGIILVGMSQLLSLAMQQRRSAHQRFIARHEVASLMEEVMSRPWSEMTTTELASLRTSEPCRERVPDAQLDIQVVPEDDATRRVHIEITWPTLHSMHRQRLALVGWRYRPQETQP